MSAAALKRGEHLALAQAAQAAYDTFPAVSPYLATSNMDGAWRVGRWMAQTGRSRPMDGTVRPGRGYLFHCNGMVLSLTWDKGACSIVRLS